MSGSARGLASGLVTEEEVPGTSSQPSEGFSRNQAGLALDEVEDLYSQHHRSMVSLYPIHQQKCPQQLYSYEPSLKVFLFE